MKQATPEIGAERLESLLRDSLLLQAFLDHSPDNIYFKDRESRFLRISRAMASYFGLKDAADIVGKTDFDFFARAHAEPAFQDEQTIIQTGRAIEGKEEKEVWPDGRVTWVSTTKIALRDAAGQIIGTFGISHDITSQKRAEQTLQDANLELELRVQSRTNELALSNQILQADIDERERVEKRQSALFRISEAAQSAPSLEKLCRAVHGIIGELMPAKNMYFALYDKAKDIIHFPYCVDERDPVRPDRKFGKGLTEYVLRTGKPLLASPGIHQQLREKGDVVQLGTPSVDWLGVPLTTHEGTIGVLCVQTYTEGLRYGDAEKDILLFVSSQIASAIERKQAEDALRRNEERFRALVENSSDAIWLLGKDGTVLYASQSSEDVTGFQRGEVVGLNLFHPDELGMIREKIGQILAQPGVAVPVEHRLRHKNGFWRQVQSVGVNRLPDPSVGAIVVNIRDVTEQRRGERVQRAIYQISEAANSAKTLDELLHSTHEVVCELMPATNFYVALYDEAAGLLTFQYFVDEVDPTPAPKKLGRGLTEYVLHSGKPLLASPEVFEELVRKGNVEMIGGPSIDWLGVPLRTSEKAFGVLVVQSYTEGVRYTEEHKEILVFVSTQVAAAIERKRAEEADRRNEERFRALVEHSSDVVALISREGKFIYCSRAVERVMGYTPEDRIGKSGFDNVHPDDLPGIRASFMQCLQQPGIPIPGEYRARHNNGSWRYLEGVSVNRLEDPAVGAIVLNYRDVTGRKNAEQAIRASEERYRIFFESNPHPMWVYDSDSQIILAVNESAIEHYGYSRSEFLAMTVADLHPEEDALARATAGDAEGKTHRHRKKDGTQIDVEVTSESLNFGGLSARLELALDVTERKRLEDQLRQSQKFEAIGLLAGGIAHDFNNVLGAMMGWAELGLMESGEGTQTHDRFQKIFDQAGRAAALTRQLLAFARRQILEARNINLNQTIVEVAGILEKTIGAQIEVKTRLAVDLRVTRADPNQLEQVLLNLCLNARDAMPQGGKLFLETENAFFDEDYCRQHTYVRPGAYVMLAVSDTGVGMDSATREHIFEPFFTTKEKGKGTGLGLATTYGIVKQHNGFIQVYSEPGRGTTFRVYLPAGEGTAERSDLHDGGAVHGGSETILLAEDHDGIRGMVRETLEALGYKLLLAQDGEQALEMFRAERSRISLVLLDVVMPRMDGPDAYVRMCEIQPDVRVVFSTGYSAEAARLSSMIEKGVTVLQKPYSPKILGRKIREILDQRR